MKTFLRHLALCALPLVGAIGAGYGFAARQRSCVSLVGPILAAKCHGRQLQYQMRFQLAGATAGTLAAAALGTWLERRRKKGGQAVDKEGGQAVRPPSL